MNFIYHFFLELLNIDLYPLRWGSFIGLGLLLGYFLIGLPVFFLFYYFLRKRSRDAELRYQSKDYLKNYRLTTISLALTLTSSLAFLASLIHFMLSIFVFEDSLQAIEWDFQLYSLISFCFFLLLTPSTFIWYRIRKKQAEKSANDTSTVKEEV